MGCHRRFVLSGLVGEHRYGLIAVYLTLVNALVHVAPAVALRRYNPGLATGVGVFLPVGVYSLWQIQRAGGGTPALHVLGLVVAVGIHVAIIGYARHRSAGLAAPPGWNTPKSRSENRLGEGDGPRFAARTA